MKTCVIGGRGDSSQALRPAIASGFL